MSCAGDKAPVNTASTADSTSAAAIAPRWLPLLPMV
jgi:hypothetical protein